MGSLGFLRAVLLPHIQKPFVFYLEGWVWGKLFGGRLGFA